jgi:hypothetical protein
VVARADRALAPRRRRRARVRAASLAALAGRTTARGIWTRSIWPHSSNVCIERCLARTGGAGGGPPRSRRDVDRAAARLGLAQRRHRRAVRRGRCRRPAGHAGRALRHERPRHGLWVSPLDAGRPARAAAGAAARLPPLLPAMVRHRSARWRAASPQGPRGPSTPRCVGVRGAPRRSVRRRR